MADNPNEVIDLDSKEFIKKANEALAAIQGIGDAKNIEGLLTGIGRATILLGSLGAVALAIKLSLDAIFEGEQIEQANKSFEALAQSMGLAGDKLKEGLVAASKGLIDDTDLLKSATKAMIELGDNSSHMIELMTIARKSTAVFGGDLTERFEMISQAVANGNTRVLRQIGLTIDSDVAIRKYAASLGVTVTSLSESGKKQALLNEVLEQANKKYKDVHENTESVTNSYQKLKVALNDLREAFVIVFEKTAGPLFKRLINDFMEGSKIIREFFVERFGNGVEHAQHRVDSLTESIRDTEDSIKRMSEHPKIMSFFIGQSQEKLERLRAELVEANSELEKLSVKKTPEGGTESGIEATPDTKPKVDYEQLKAERAKFEQDILAIKEQRLNNEMELATNFDQVEEIHNQQKQALADQFAQRAMQLQAEVAQGKISEVQAAELIDQTWQATSSKLEIMDQRLLDQRLKSLDQYQKASTSTSDGIVRAFQAGSQRNAAELTNFGKRGQAVYDSFSKHAVGALQDLGAGTKSATQVMKGFFFGMLADQAEQYGQFMLLSSIWPPNPAGLAAGAALLVLSGFLRSQAGGAGGGAGGGAASAGAAGSSAGGFVSTTNPESNIQGQAKEKNAVNIVVQGSYFDSGETARRITELVRESADATDFRITTIGAR